jgi:hypothetical protein
VFSWTYQGLDDMTPAHGAGPTELATVQRVGEQVLLGDDPDEPVLLVNHRKGGVAVPGQQRRRVLDRLPLRHHEYRLGHDMVRAHLDSSTSAASDRETWPGCLYETR